MLARLSHRRSLWLLLAKRTKGEKSHELRYGERSLERQGMAMGPSAQSERKPNIQRLLMWNVSPSMADSLFAWSNVVLVVGAAAVLIGTIGSIKMGAIREHFADIRISENERATAQAVAESDIAKESAAKANAAAAEAQLALEQFKADRTLNADQQTQLIGKLKKFAGQLYILSVVPEQEPIRLIKLLDTILTEAGWKNIPGPAVVRTAEGIAVSTAVAPGVRVQIASSRAADDGFVTRAREVAEALNDEGIAAEAAKVVEIETDPTAIQIRVGSKPK